MVTIPLVEVRHPTILSLSRWGLLLGLFVAGLCGVDHPTEAQEVADTPTPRVVEPDIDPKQPIQPDNKERRIKLTAGLAALAGITITGIVFGAMIIIWAGRLRRIVREPNPATGRQDPFWFLRPEKIIAPRDTDEFETTNPESQ